MLTQVLEKQTRKSTIPPVTSPAWCRKQENLYDNAKTLKQRMALSTEMNEGARRALFPQD